MKLNLQSLLVWMIWGSGHHTSDMQVIPLLKQDQGGSLICPVPVKSQTGEWYIKCGRPQPCVADRCLSSARAESVLGTRLFICFVVSRTLLKSMILIDLILVCPGSPKPLELLQ